MATLPRARTRVEATSGKPTSGANTITLIGPAPLNADGKPRRFASATALLAFHGYSELAEYFAMHVEETGFPAVVCAIPIETDGAVSGIVTTGKTGTSVVTITAPGAGVLTEHEGVLSVLAGGTIGTSQIVLGISLDGGLTTKRVRLGTANSYLIPYVGVNLAFGAGTLVTGDVVTWKGSAPAGDAAGIALARTMLAASQVKSKSWLVIGDAEPALATAVLTQVGNYDTANERFVRARVQARDKLSSETKVEWLDDVVADYAGVVGYGVGIGIGRGRKLSPITGYSLRRPVQWAAAIREYQHDYHVATWKKDEGPLVGWSIDDADQNLVEYDDRVDGAVASAAGFTSFRTWANGPAGVCISQDLTRAPDGNILVYTHNVDVTNLARTVVQRETENAIGSSLTLNPDGTATTDSLKTIAGRVNSALAREVVINIGEGVRCSSCVWTPSEDDVLSGAEALLTGTLDLVLNGTLHSVLTTIKVS